MSKLQREREREIVREGERERGKETRPITMSGPLLLRKHTALEQEHVFLL